MFARSVHLAQKKICHVYLFIYTFFFFFSALWNGLPFGTYKEVTHQLQNRSSFYLNGEMLLYSPNLVAGTFQLVENALSSKTACSFFISLPVLFARPQEIN